MKEDFDLKEELKKLPHSPGVYLMHDEKDEIIYVGKAIDLNNRVRSYFGANVGRGPWIDIMVSLIAYFEYIVTDSELEALVLENNLIKEHHPKYNTMLMDDKTYPFIKVTTDKDYPRISFVREVKKDRARYFGPYQSAAAVKDTIELINKLYRLRTCNITLKEGVKTAPRPCLNYHMGQCSAPCQGNISREKYNESLKGALDFLGGNYGPVCRELKEKMETASMELEFEKAAAYRDLLESVKVCAQNQKITDSNMEDRDIIAAASMDCDAVVQIFYIRSGRMIGRDHFFMRIQKDSTKGHILTEFIKQHYGGTPFIPPRLYVQEEVEDRDILISFLTAARGARTEIIAPKKGMKEKLVELAAQNAKLVLEKDRERIKKEAARTRGAMDGLEELLGLEGIHRVEAFDISNTSGYGNVASMVVFEDGRPKKRDYRKFRIKSVEGPNDYECMREVLYRRLAGEHCDAHGAKPDLLLMDGGKGQVNIALQVLEELGMNIPVCGMVKDDRHRTRGLYYNNNEVPMEDSRETFMLITRIQDEAHRFAITFHRSLRNKTAVHSILDDIPGIGPARRKLLMQHYGSIDEIKAASREELLQIDGIPEGAANSIYSFFHSNMVK